VDSSGLLLLQPIVSWGGRREEGAGGERGGGRRSRWGRGWVSVSVCVCVGVSRGLVGLRCGVEVWEEVNR